MQVCFVAHGGRKTGMGHVMRALSLAEAFRERGHSVSFFSRYRPGIELLQRHGFDVSRIPCEEEPDADGFFYGRKTEAEQDAEHIRDRLPRMADVMVVDSYNVTERFFLILREKTGILAYIDDLNAFSCPVDVLINGSASAFQMGYEKTQSARLLLGFPYILLRREFRAVPPKDVNPRLENILITTGNSDPFHMTEKLLAILKQEKAFEEIRFHAVIGNGFEADSLENPGIWSGLSVHLHHSPENMAELMQRCDMAVTAGGSTLYELAACGVPAVAFAYADNQTPQIRAMEEMGLLQYIGSYREIDGQKLITDIRNMQQDHEKRRKLAAELQRLVNAYGSVKVVKEIEALSSCRNEGE